MWSRVFRALTISVEIRLESDRLVSAMVAVTGSYPSSQGPVALSYSVQGTSAPYTVLRAGEVIDDAASELDLPSIIELDMLRSCVVEATGCVVLHAAAVTIGDATVVMVGPSGAGKTTLTRALLQTGAEYRSDECVAISASGEVQGLARPVHLDAGKEQGLDASQIHEHRWLDEHDLVILDRFWHPPAGQKPVEPGVLKSLVLVAYSPTATGTREELTSGEALASLWPCVLNQCPESLDILTGLVEERRVHVLRTSSVDSACTLVRRGLG